MNRSSVHALLLLAGLLVVPGCGEGGAEPREEGIDRETFVATYVDLRRAAIRDGPDPITPEARDRVLERHGVSSEELLEFVEIHGRDLEYMEAVWDTVEAILGQEPPEDSLPVAEELPLSDSLP